MSTTAALSIVKPTILSAQLLKPRIHNRIFGPRLHFYPRKSSCYFPMYKKLRCPNNSMTEAIRIRAGNGEGGIRAFEPEAFVNGSSSSFSANGLEAILNNLSKWLVTILFGIFLLWKHDAEALWAAMGSVINAGLSSLLKKLLNQERPVAYLRSDPGMPSNHAQSIFFVTTLAILSTVQSWGLNGLTTAISGIVLAAGSYFSWLRVSQQLHTFSQVVVGALLGTIFSILWFWSWDSIVVKAFLSYMWVRILVVLGGAAFCMGFVLYIIRYRVMETVTLYITRKL
ncbi:hypothetical protein ACH5RR_011787 [Cinchona calisaya]|uniref:Phosphatidic acid phosphatase type 2/haloperoxidase domain-containing protein n=1 Tax=Cinchona calisaya TaxID=153742 RepID=A0ABD3A5V8_9GENT